jgi:hypothetical protein
MILYLKIFFQSIFQIFRTQSGGDTYFCIDALLRDKEQDFSILTPLGMYIYVCMRIYGYVRVCIYICV